MLSLLNRSDFLFLMIIQVTSSYHHHRTKIFFSFHIKCAQSKLQLTSLVYNFFQQTDDFFVKCLSWNPLTKTTKIRERDKKMMMKYKEKSFFYHLHLMHLSLNCTQIKNLTWHMIYMLISSQDKSKSNAKSLSGLLKTINPDQLQLLK